MNTYFIIEASHLFRAGEIHAAQLYVVDVVNYLAREVFDTPVAQTWVLFGSTKESQADKYIQAVERTGTKVIRMTPVDSRIVEGNKFYKPSTYLHEIFAELAPGSQVVLVGFHNTRFEDLLRKYQSQFEISLCAFTTRSKTNHEMRIPDHFVSIVKHAVSLDKHVNGIKTEYRRAKTSPDSVIS
jgi:hypothetical protein